ncbi:metallophosphoesterase family protein [Actinomyces sp. zg328]|uniref:metallophosphoesterase family protein n=1 Tax=Actinomyces sp. zg328 TaxID=2609287 RepID=UPI001F35F0BC|nr:serine/threonine protein phosphatase [Actinomyces sp. zg328]
MTHQDEAPHEAGISGRPARAASPLAALIRTVTRPRRVISRVWWSRGAGFRRVVRALGLLLVSGTISLGLGAATAQASSPVGPHEAHWSTNLDSVVVLDLGPLGSASMDSPVPPLGARVVLGEIPSSMGVAPVDTASLGESLSQDANAYLTLASRPGLTIDRGVHALIDDALRRAGLIESLLLTAVAAGRLSAKGRLRALVGMGLRRRPAAALAGVGALATMTVMLAPVLRPTTVPGETIPALEGTSFASARLSGRIADIAAAYGGTVTGFIRDNQAFYARAQSNLRAAWTASQRVGGRIDVTASSGGSDEASIQSALSQSQAAHEAAAARPAAGPSPSAAPSATDAAAPPWAGPSPSPSAGSAPTIPATPSQALATRANEAPVTAVMSTDLHCNLDVISFTGLLDQLARPDVHMDDGDLAMTGSNPEQVCVDALSRAVPSGVARVATIGNHDSEATAERLRGQGWTVTGGKPVKAGPLTVLGDDDVERTTAAGTTQRGAEDAAQLGQRLSDQACRAANAGSAVDVVLVHRPQAFAPLQASGCAPLLLAGHVHEERGMTAVDGERGRVNALTSGAGKGGTSIGPVTQEAWLHELAFTSDGALIAWRAIILRPDASVTVGAWQGPPQPTGAPVATGGATAAPGPTGPTGPAPTPGTAPSRGAAPAAPASAGDAGPDPTDEADTRGATRAEG